MKELSCVTMGFLAGLTHCASAQTLAAPASYPARTADIVVGFPPGGGVDVMKSEIVKWGKVVRESGASAG